jgi:hypothetical protein
LYLLFQQQNQQFNIYKADMVFEDGFVTLEAFLDSESTCDNTAFGSMCKASEEHKVEQGLVRCIYATLRNQKTVTA